MSGASDGALAAARARLDASERLLVFTGAGVSAESGVPTFRGPGGMWKSHRAEALATPEGFARDPRLVWEWYAWRRGLVAACAPNAAHVAIARRAAERPGTRVVTQNVDGLHERAARERAARERAVSDGTVRPDAVRGDAAPVIALHGRLMHSRCVRWPACATRGPHEALVDAPIDVSTEATLPRCPRCGALLRPDVVWFGEPLDEGDLAAASDAALGADAVLVVGTSALVQPAAGIAMLAARRGAPLVEVNAEETPLSTLAAVSLRGPAGTLVPALLDPR